MKLRIDRRSGRRENRLIRFSLCAFTSSGLFNRREISFMFNSASESFSILIDDEGVEVEGLRVFWRLESLDRFEHDEWTANPSNYLSSDSRLISSVFLCVAKASSDGKDDPSFHREIAAQNLRRKLASWTSFTFSQNWQWINAAKW